MLINYQLLTFYLHKYLNLDKKEKLYNIIGDLNEIN
mgnify:CR=1 FL=1